MAKRKRKSGGELVACEAFFHTDQSALCWVVAKSTDSKPVFDIRWSDHQVAVNTVVERVVVGQEAVAMEVEMFQHPQDFVVEAAALKMMKRLIKERIGGKDGWEQVYNGPFCLEKLEGRETVSPFGEPAPEIGDNPELEEGSLFSGSDDDFAARRRAKKNRKRVKAEESLEEQALNDEGKTKIRAFHSSDDLKQIGKSVALVAVWALPTETVNSITHSQLSPDCAVASGTILNNNNMYATIVADLSEGSEHLADDLHWYYGTEAPILVGKSEPTEEQRARRLD